MQKQKHPPSRKLSLHLLGFLPNYFLSPVTLMKNYYYIRKIINKMAKVKYIRTKDNRIIVFSDLQQHSEFKRFNPISAGFISIGIGSDGNPDCTCYGESVSLGLKSLEDDTRLAKRQILGWDYY